MSFGSMLLDENPLKNESNNIIQATLQWDEIWRWLVGHKVAAFAITFFVYISAMGGLLTKWVQMDIMWHYVSL